MLGIGLGAGFQLSADERVIFVAADLIGTGVEIHADERMVARWELGQAIDERLQVHRWSPSTLPPGVPTACQRLLNAVRGGRCAIPRVHRPRRDGE